MSNDKSAEIVRGLLAYCNYEVTGHGERWARVDIFDLQQAATKITELNDFTSSQCAKLLERVAELEGQLEAQGIKAATDAVKLINEMERYKHLCNATEAQLAASKQRERAAVECIEEIEYQNRKFYETWIEAAIDEWRGQQQAEEEQA